MHTIVPPPVRRSDVAAPNYYSMRRLSPYQGTIQVVELPGFRAMSADGSNWDLRIENRGMRPAHALWREGEAYNVEITERTAPFLTALRDHPPLPFPLADTLELWLLDARNLLPLALLASTLPHMAPPNRVNTSWRAAFPGDDMFVAASLQSGAVPPEQPFIPHREILDRCVRKAAGTHPRAQWFRRDAAGAGSGVGGTGIEPALFARELAAAQFPELLLREYWDSETEAALVRDYHDWLAPALLTHSSLSRRTRERLERAACTQAEKLFRVRQLLPEVVNRDLIDVALVEAVLRRSSSVA
jgi:hypothetical protein